MTVLYDESYPPSVWLDVGRAMPFDPSSFASLAALKADPVHGDGVYAGPVFTVGQYVTLGNGTRAHYSGTVWNAGGKPAGAADPEPDPDLVIDPALHTIAEIKQFVTAMYDVDDLDADDIADLQAVLDAERAGQNRATLVAWLDGIEGLL